VDEVVGGRLAEGEVDDVSAGRALDDCGLGVVLGRMDPVVDEVDVGVRCGTGGSASGPGVPHPVSPVMTAIDRSEPARIGSVVRGVAVGLV